MNRLLAGLLAAVLAAGVKVDPALVAKGIEDLKKRGT
jgi:hypothetical protein